MPNPENFNTSDNTNTTPVENVGITQSSTWNQNSMDTWRAASSAGRPETASSLPADFSIDFGDSNGSNTSNESNALNYNNANDSNTSDSNANDSNANDSNALNISFDSSTLNSSDGSTPNNAIDGSAPTSENRTSQVHERQDGRQDEKPSENPENGPMKRPLQDAPPRLDVASCTPPGPRNDGSDGWNRVINALSDVTTYRSCLNQQEQGIQEYNRQRAEDDRNWANGEGPYAR